MVSVREYPVGCSSLIHRRSRFSITLWADGCCLECLETPFACSRESCTLPIGTPLFEGSDLGFSSKRHKSILSEGICSVAPVEGNTPILDITKMARKIVENPFECQNVQKIIKSSVTDFLIPGIPTFKICPFSQRFHLIQSLWETFLF